MKKSKPGELFNIHKALAMKKKNMGGVPSGDGRTLRSADTVVSSEQKSSHQFYKRKKRKMTNRGLIKKGGKKNGKTNIGVMKQTQKQTRVRK